MMQVRPQQPDQDQLHQRVRRDMQRETRVADLEVRLSSNSQSMNGSSRNSAAPLIRCRIDTRPGGGSW